MIFFNNTLIFLGLLPRSAGKSDQSKLRLDHLLIGECFQRIQNRQLKVEREKQSTRPVKLLRFEKIITHLRSCNSRPQHHLRASVCDEIETRNYKIIVIYCPVSVLSKGWLLLWFKSVLAFTLLLKHTHISNLSKLKCSKIH